MARPDPTQFLDKTRLVATAVAAAQGPDRDKYDFSRDVAPGVHLILSEAPGCPVALSLWTHPEDIVEICADAAVPVASALLAVDASQVRAVAGSGCGVDLSQFIRSQGLPGWYYVLLDETGVRRLPAVLRRLVPGPSAAAHAA